MGEMAYSYSRINTYDKCPLRFKRAYIDRIKAPVADMLLSGGAVHKFCEIYVRTCRKLGYETYLNGVEDLALQAFAEAKLPSYLQDECMVLCRYFAETHLIDLKANALIETKLAINKEGKKVDWFASDVYFRGIFDYAETKEDSAYIVDYKTGFKKDYDTFQLKIYAWLMSKIYPNLKKFKVDIDLIRFEVLEGKEFGLDDIAKVEKMVSKKIEVIEQDSKFEPAPGSHCIYCPYSDRCTAISDIVEESKEEDIGLNLAKEVIVLETQLKHKKELLKSYCGNYGAVKINDIEFGVFRIDTTKYNISEFITRLDKAGINALDYLQVDGRKIPKLRKIEVAAKILSEIGEIKSALRFKGRKIKEETNASN